MKRRTFDTVRPPFDLPQLRVEPHLDLRIGEHPGGQGFLGPELVPAVDHEDPRGEVGEVHGLVAGGVPASDDEHPLGLEEGAVAGGAVGNAVARQLRLPGDAEAVVHGAGGKDDRQAGAGSLVRFHREDVAVLRDGESRPAFSNSAPNFRACSSIFWVKSYPLIGLRESRVVLQAVDQERLASRGHFLQDEGAQVSPGAVLGGGQDPPLPRR